MRGVKSPDPVSAGVTTLLLLMVCSAAHAHVLRVPSEYPTIGQAVDSAASGDTVEVAAGTYTGAQNRNINPAGRDIVFLAPEGNAVTTIDCEDLGRGFNFQSGETASTIVQGFTIRNGNGYATASSNGGAVRCSGSSPRFLDCAFRDCAGQFGGALYVGGGSPSFERCRFVNNFAPDGGGARLDDDGTCFSHCVFRSNSGEGGAISFIRSSAKILWCEFSENRWPAATCCLMIWFSPGPEIANCTFCANTSYGSTLGPVLGFFGGCTPVIRNVVIAFNDAAACRSWGASSPVFEFTLSFGNTVNNNLCGTVTNSAITNPMLCDVANDDYSPCADSPCLPGNNPWGVLIGAHEAGCGPCATSVDGRTWGVIKGLYR